jgi:surface antigen
MITDSPTKSANGHTAIVLGINKDGSMLMADANGYGRGAGNGVGTFTAQMRNGQLVVDGKIQGQVYGFHTPNAIAGATK